jgi:hypothetical protein
VHTFATQNRSQMGRPPPRRNLKESSQGVQGNEGATLMVSPRARSAMEITRSTDKVALEFTFLRKIPFSILLQKFSLL